jgi:hypothetical protein
MTTREHQKMAKEPRIERPISEMIQELRADVGLLREYTLRAFHGREVAFAGEVAGKLRVLVHDQGCNKPLLLNLIEEFGINVKLRFDLPGEIVESTLREYLDDTAFVHRIEGRGLVEVKRKELIAIWSQQAGASHKDWSVEERFDVAMRSGIDIGGLPAAMACLASIARTVLHAADVFLSQVTPEMIAGKK